ncbi:MAG: acyl carrier protein [Bacteroidetes bacterium]|nr:acyl carrier protein [Bacteroidota bacterium]
MDREEEILKEINSIFCNELSDDSIKLDFDSSADSVEKWDSINNLIIISSIEDHYGITFPLEVIFEAKNIGDLVNYIKNHS